MIREQLSWHGNDLVSTLICPDPVDQDELLATLLAMQRKSLATGIVPTRVVVVIDPFTIECLPGKGCFPLVRRAEGRAAITGIPSATRP